MKRKHDNTTNVIKIAITPVEKGILSKKRYTTEFSEIDPKFNSQFLSHFKI